MGSTRLSYRLRTRSAAVVGKDNKDESNGCTNNEGHENAYNKCPYGNPRRPKIGLELCDAVDRVITVGQLFGYVRQRTDY